MHGQLSYKKFEETLNRELKERVTYNSIRSKGHKIYSISISIKQTKFALSNYDGKRYWLSDCESVPYGDYLIDDDMLYLKDDAPSNSMSAERSD